RRSSCQRGDSPIARPVIRVRTSGAKVCFDDITASLRQGYGDFVDYATSLRHLREGHPTLSRPIPVNSRIVGNPSFSRVRRSWSSLTDCGLSYGHFATSFRMVFVPRIVNGTRSTFARGTVAKSDVSGFWRRHQ